jgi:hypothetical protein
MKTKILTFALLVSSLVTFGQVEKNSKDRNRFGIKAGLNYSNIIYGGNVDFKPGVGYSLGLIFNAVSSKKLVLPVELLYNKFNSSTKYSDLNLSSVNVNFMLHFYTSKNFYIETGLLFSYYINEEGVTKVLGPREFIIIDLPPRLMEFDIAPGVGIGYEFTNRTFVNLRYSYGILGVFLLDDYKSAFSNLSLNVGYSF